MTATFDTKAMPKSRAVNNARQDSRRDFLRQCHVPARIPACIVQAYEDGMYPVIAAQVLMRILRPALRLRDDDMVTAAVGRMYDDLDELARHRANRERALQREVRRATRPADGSIYPSQSLRRSGVKTLPRSEWQGTEWGWDHGCESFSASVVTDGVDATHRPRLVGGRHAL